MLTDTDLYDGPRLAPDAPKGLGKMMAGGGDKAKRRALDFYPTPPEATRAFLMAESASINRHLAPVLDYDEATNSGMWHERPQVFWEPCGRGGAIATVANEFGYDAVASDIVADAAHGVARLDLLEAKKALALIVITNPPFALWRPMLVRLLVHLKCDYVAFLLKASVMNSEASAALAAAGLAPNGRWDICWRLDFTGGGNPTMDCSWFVWDMRDRAMRGGPLRRDGPVRGSDQGLL